MSGHHGLAGDGVQPGGALGLLVDEEDAAAPGDPVSPGSGQGADPLQVQVRRHVCSPAAAAAAAAFSAAGTPSREWGRERGGSGRAAGGRGRGGAGAGPRREPGRSGPSAAAAAGPAGAGARAAAGASPSRGELALPARGTACLGSGRTGRAAASMGVAEGTQGPCTAGGERGGPAAPGDARLSRLRNEIPDSRRLCP